MKRFLILLLAVFFVLTLTGCKDNEQSECLLYWNEETQTCEEPDDNKDPIVDPVDDKETDYLDYEFLTHIDFEEWQINALTNNQYQTLFYYDEDTMLFHNQNWILITEESTTESTNSFAMENFLGFDPNTNTVHYTYQNRWYEHVVGTASQDISSTMIGYEFESSYIGNDGFVNEGRFFNSDMSQLETTQNILSYQPGTNFELVYTLPELENQLLMIGTTENKNVEVGIQYDPYVLGDMVYRFYDTEVYEIYGTLFPNVVGYISISRNCDHETEFCTQQILEHLATPEEASNVQKFERSLSGFRKEITYQYQLDSEYYYVTFSPDLSTSITMTSNQNNHFVYLSNDYAIFNDDGMITIYDTEMNLLHTYDFADIDHLNEVRAQVEEDFIILDLNDQHAVIYPTDWSYIINNGHAYAYGDVIISPNMAGNDTYFFYDSNIEFTAMPVFEELLLGQSLYYLVNGDTFRYTTVDVYDYTGTLVNTLNHVIRYNNYYLKQFIVEIDGEYYLLGDTTRFITE